MSISSRYINFSVHEKKIFNKLSHEIKKLIINLKNKLEKKFLKKFFNSIKDIGITKIDYIEIRNEQSLLISNACKKSRLFIALYVGKIRVIDNFILY